MNSENNQQAYVNIGGDLVIPADIASRYGIVPEAKLHLDENEDGIFLRRPVSHLAKIYIEPTSRCNLSCRTCIRNAWNEPMGEMEEATFESIISGIEGLDHPPKLFFGGFGEPLSHPRIVDMVARAKEVSHTVELITNAMLLTKERSRTLIQAGLSALWVSVDGASPESYADIRVGAALPDIFHNIGQYSDQYRQIIGSKPEIGLAFVAMKRNIADLPELLKMSIRLGVSRYLVTNVLPYTTEMCAERLYTRSMNNFIGPASPWAPSLDIPQMDISAETREPLIRTMSVYPYHIPMNIDLAKRRDRCPFIRSGSTAIAWNGDLSPCLPLMHQHESYLVDIRRIVHRHVVGNVREQGLRALWESPEYVGFRKRVDEFDFSPCTVCASCDLAESNQEDCFGNTFPTCGGCLWAQGFIRCP